MTHANERERKGRSWRRGEGLADVDDCEEARQLDLHAGAAACSIARLTAEESGA